MSIEFGDDFLGLDLVSPNVDWGLGLVNDEIAYPLGDAFLGLDDVDGLDDVGCGCGMGELSAAEKEAKKEAKKEAEGGGFPVGAVVAGVGGLALGIVAVFGIRKLLK